MRNFSSSVFRFGAAILATGILAGCSGSVREHIRARDFRSVRAADAPAPAASPIPNVPDMPGWTTDLGSAQEFARENGRRTIVFVQQSGHPASQRAKDILTSERVENALGEDLKVTVDLGTAGFDAGRLGVNDAPALVILDPAGTPSVRRVGPFTQKSVLSALSE